ncbi:hypothetical protein [Nonomuraea lactucae]|uniref:hypothetical protein n=1 Tax=Nonomuraea lactucae TaxID=2249762 RepID=UPI000DE27456|nr:hypothetical protein [Nonomuraea lactucae]
MNVHGLLEGALEALHRQQERARRTLTMIPSENSFSALAKLPQLTDAAHRYFFDPDGDPGTRRFPAGRDASWIETELTLPLLRDLTGATYVNVRPLSGLHAMTVVLSALGGPPDSTVASIDPTHGGHYATTGLARRLGLRPVLIGGPDPYHICYDALTRLVARHHPRLVYLDLCHGLFPIDIAAAVAAVRAAGGATRVHVDVSHTMGLVLGAALPNPLAAGADSFGGSMHKTFPGPQKAILATCDREVADIVATAQVEMISSHHLAAVCSLGLALAEFVACDGPGYAREVVAAAKALGAALDAAGLTPEAAEHGYTGCHQLWARTDGTGVDAVSAAERLERGGIHVNVLNDLPGTDGEPALRLGVAEPIAVGLTAADMPQVAALIAAAVSGARPSTTIARDVAALRAARTRRHQLPPDSPLLARADELARAALSVSDPIAGLASSIRHRHIDPALSVSAPSGGEA